MHTQDDARVLYILWVESVGASSSTHSSLSEYHQTARSETEALIRWAQGVQEIDPTLDPKLLALQFTSTLFRIAYQ